MKKAKLTLNKDELIAFNSIVRAYTESNYGYSGRSGIIIKVLLTEILVKTETKSMFPQSKNTLTLSVPQALAIMTKIESSGFSFCAPGSYEDAVIVHVYNTLYKATS
jgi:hypothetical protein